MNGLLQSLVTVGGTIFSMSISAVAVIILSRHLGPEAFGQFNVGFSLLLIVAQTADLGINLALNKLAGATQDKARINRILIESTRLKGFSIIFFILLGLVATPILTHWLQFDSWPILLGAFVLSAAVIWFDHLLYVLRSLHLFYKAVAIMVLQATLKVVGIIALLAVGITSPGWSFLWYAIAPAVPVLLTPFLLPKWVTYQFNQTFTAEKTLLTQVMKHTGVFLIAQTIVDNVDVLFVQRYVSATEVGLYSGISRIALLLTFAGYALGMVLNPRVARYHRAKDIQKYLPKALLVGLAAGLGFIAFLPFERLIIHYSIGPAYLPGIPYLRIMIASSFLVFATVPFTALFYSLKKSWYFSLLGGVQILSMLLGNVIFTPWFGLAGATWVKFGVRLLALVVTIGLALYSLNKSTSAVNKDRVIKT